MTIDWNWFFAAFAQCAAGLIAIIGAFIISKLLGESEKEEIHSSNIDQLIIQYNDIIKRISRRRFNWHDQICIKYSSKLEEAIKQSKFNELNDDEKLQKLFKIEVNLFRTPICLRALDERIKSLKSENRYLIGILDVIPNGLWDNINEEREIVNQLQIESEILIEKFEKAKNDISIVKNNLFPIKTTIYILGVGLLLTVIYPLHFMPIGLNQNPTLSFSFDLIYNHLFSIKGLLLFLLTVVIEGIFGYFLWLIKHIEKKYAITASKLVKKYFLIKDYCPYFN